MQLPLTRSSSRFARALCAVLVLSAATTPPHMQAQSRRAKTSASKSPASSKAAKIRTLEARLRKATATYDRLGEVVNGQAIFLVQGTIERGDRSRLLVYARSYGRNPAASRSLGQNFEERFLTIHNPEPRSIINGRYEGECIALSQTDFAPVPAQYRQAEIALSKAQGIVVSLQNEIEFEKQSGARAARAREKVRLARAKEDKVRQEKAQTAQRESVYRARVALADRETAAKIAQLDGLVSGASDKGGAYLQSSAAAVALFNKWGSLGVANRTMLERAFDDLANAAAWQVERGDWASTVSISERLVSLELFSLAASDAQTGKERIELGVEPGGVPGAGQLSSKAVNFVMRREGGEREGGEREGGEREGGEREGGEPAAASRLAQAWLSKLPAYIAGPATRAEKLRVAELSQLLGADVFALDAERTQTIAFAVDAVRGTYGPGALSVFPRYETAVEIAKRARVARQVEAFSSPSLPYRAPDNRIAASEVVPNGESLLPYRAPANQVFAAPQAPTEQPAPKAAERPLEKPPVPALDFGMRSFKTGRKVRLSDFKGKTVILYFWDAGWMEDRDVSPTPAEQLFALSKRYDPKKVVFLLVNENGFADETVKRYREIIDPTPDAGRDQRRSYGPRLYPEVAYSLDIGMSMSAERVVSEAALVFYTGNKNVSYNAMRVSVVSPAGQVVGSVDFEEDRTATLFNNDKQRGQGTYVVYDFDETALEDLLARAMAPQQ